MQVIGVIMSYGKLVRDKIIDIIHSNGENPFITRLVMKNI